MSKSVNNILLLSGGVGGAKLVKGFADLQREEPIALSVAINTGDDFRQMGLAISPDIDTLSYTLAELNNRQQGWGVADESWNCMEHLAKLGAPTWFQLGDKDLAMHIWRSWQLAEGRSLSEVTAEIATSVGIQGIKLWPMSDNTVNTRLQVHDDDGQLTWLDFQEYFVKARCQPTVAAIAYEGAAKAQLSPALEQLLTNSHSTSATGDQEIDAIVIAPSNPLLSVAPILAIPTMREHLRRLRKHIPVIAVSPLIEGKAIKGPTAKLMTELGMRCDNEGIAHFYCDIINGLVIDNADTKTQMSLENMNIRQHSCSILMDDAQSKINLARECMGFAHALSAHSRSNHHHFAVATAAAEH